MLGKLCSEMAGFGDYSGYNRPYGLDPHRETNDLYDTRYQQIYGYHTPVTEEFQGPPLVMDDIPEDGMPTCVFYACLVFYLYQTLASLRRLCSPSAAS